MKDYIGGIMPGRNGLDCRQNGNYKNEKGEIIDKFCDDCFFWVCCSSFHKEEFCDTCEDEDCPRFYLNKQK